jgi:large exoprotein involved in heme utilization and adhesion
LPLPNDNLDHFSQLGQIKISGSKIGNDTHVPENGARNIYIRGNGFWVDNTVINARPVKERTNDVADGIRIDVRDTVTLKSTDGSTMLFTDTYSATDAGNITINTAHLMMHNDATISNDSKSTGAAGNITIQANDITMTEEADIGSYTSNNGNLGGNIKITATDFLRMSDNAHIDATTRSTNQKTGLVKITAGDIKMYDKTIINIGTYDGGNGDSDEAIINAHTLTMTNKANIFSSSFSKGQSGHISITVDDLKLTGQSAIASTAFSEGQAGNIDIQVTDTLSLSQNAVINAGTEGVGSGGNVNIKANQVVIKNNALISTASEIKNASAVNEDALIERIAGLIKRIIDTGAYPYNTIIFKGGGKAGSIIIKANNISLTDGATITCFSGGIGLAGNIEITVNENLNLQASKISTAAAKADGGNIRLQTKGLINLYDSAITATVGGGAGDGGNINIGKIIAPEHVILNNGKIIANAFEGDGGNIYIVTDNLLQSIGSAITASSEKGIDGTVYIESPEDELGEGAFIQPKDFFDARRLSPKECETHNPRNNKFIIPKRDGLYKSPDDMAH